MTDLISRQDLLKELPYANWGKEWDEALAKAIIESMPTIDPVKHGKWEPFDLTWGRSVYACSSCRDAMEVPREMGRPIYNYCPNCGAKMNEEEDDE